MIQRPLYLAKFIKAKGNGFPKVITGLRRCGKSYLLTDIYPACLRSVGVPEEAMIYIALDNDANESLRDPIELGKRVRALASRQSVCYYVFLDEIQKV